MQRLTRRVSVIRMTNRAARQSHRRQHVVGSDSSVALEWPRPIACLQRVAMGTLLLSRRSWSVHLARGRPGGRFHGSVFFRPTDSSTWRSMAWCAGMLSGNLATCPNMALRSLVIRSDTGARPMRKETSELRTKLCHLIPRILRWHFTWKDSMAFMSLANKVHVSDTYRRTDRTSFNSFE